MLNKILFFGNERLATGLTTTAPTLRSLIAAGYEITGVVVAQNETGPSRQERQLEIVQVAEEHQIPVLTIDDLAASAGQIAAFGAEAAVLVAYGKIVPPDIIKIFPRGIINIHPSLLPKHRGSTPIESVILSGETETGVSLMRLVPEMDAGPLFAQAKMPVPAGISKADLANSLLNKGAELLIQQLPAILDGSLQPVEQDEAAATTDKQIEKSDGVIDWQKPAVQLEQEIRAYLGWPRSRTTLGNIDLIITKAHAIAGGNTPGVLQVADNQLSVQTSDGILVIDSLIPAGKKEMPAAAFLAGYHITQ